jgi:hypothetical protein
MDRVSYVDGNASYSHDGDILPELRPEDPPLLLLVSSVLNEEFHW